MQTWDHLGLKTIMHTTRLTILNHLCGLLLTEHEDCLKGVFFMVACQETGIASEFIRTNRYKHLKINK